MTRIDTYFWVGLFKQKECQLHNLVKLIENTCINLVDFVHLPIKLLLEYLHLLLFFLV